MSHHRSHPTSAPPVADGPSPAIEVGLPTGKRLVPRSSSSGAVVSLVVHLVALVLLGLVAEVASNSRRPLVISALPGTGEEPVGELTLDKPPSPMDDETDDQEVQVPQPIDREIAPPIELEIPVPLPFATASPTSSTTPDPRDLLASTDQPLGGGLTGRTAASRARLVARRGGSPESELAVTRGLAWLAAHQRPNGAWLFDHREGPCADRCRHPGTHGSSTGATAIALLAFLGAGETSELGVHQETVRRGLYYLVGRMTSSRQGGDFQEGSMYSQGLSAIALAEAYALTADETWRVPAQRAIDFILSVQHARGGFRYFPGQPGDTTVTGWQLMALKSGKLARLTVPDEAFERAEQFLDGLQTGEGAFYGYIRRGKVPTPTAVGLLSRMYLGWRRDDPRLAKGAEYLAHLRPSTTDMYFNYYATQVLCHLGGARWERWNGALRDYLIETQATADHEAGSWYFEDPHGVVGGRHYTTALCVMMLEVYYRHLPLYGEDAVD